MGRKKKNSPPIHGSVAQAPTACVESTPAPEGSWPDFNDDDLAIGDAEEAAKPEMVTSLTKIPAKQRKLAKGI